MDKNDFLAKYLDFIPDELKTEFKLDYNAVQRRYYVDVFNAIKEECDGTYEINPDDWNFVEGSPVDLISAVHKILITA
jgi:hypothetical protein